MSETYKWIKRMDMIEFSIVDRVARITLNRPDKRNALSDELREQLIDALLEADDRLDVSVVILEANGKDFCAGADLSAAFAKYDADAEAESAAKHNQAKYRSTATTIDNDCWRMEQMPQLPRTIHEMHKPVIAKVKGNCLADGTDVIFACDLIVAADDAKIGHPAARANGTPPNHRWIYHCGPQWAKRLLFTGDRVTGEDAAKIGLVLASYPAEQLDAEVDALAQRISFVDAEVLATHKRVVNMALDLSGAQILQRFSLEYDAIAHATNGPRRQQFRTDIAAKGLKAALQSRDEPFGDGFAKVTF